MGYLFNQEAFQCSLMSALEKGRKPNSFFKYYVFNYMLNHRLGILEEAVGKSYDPLVWNCYQPNSHLSGKGEIIGINKFFKEFNAEMKGFGKLKPYKERGYGNCVGYDYTLKMKNSEYVFIASVNKKKDSVVVYTGITDVHSVFCPGSHDYIPLRCYVSTAKEIADWFKMIDEKAGSELKPEFDKLVLKLYGNNNIKEIARSTFKALFDDKKKERDCTLNIAEGKVEQNSDKMSCTIRLGQWVCMQLTMSYTTDDWETIVKSIFTMYDVYDKHQKLTKQTE